MASYEGSIVIDAPVSEVFAYANAPSTMPDWMSALVEVRNVIGSGAGLQWEWTYKMAGVHVRGQSVIVDYILNECATHQGIGMLSVDWTTMVEPHDGGTKLTAKLEYTIPVPVLGRLAEHLTIRRNARELDASLLNLKETLEA
ncbi:MAG: SRPBCC family protein [Deltaproteobacteria bacterium]|nr:SRPBCC family protein [Deltaproteobacteria bacterium]